MAYQCNCITDNRLFSAVRAAGLPRAVINRFVMHYKLSTGGQAGRPEQCSPTHLQKHDSLFVDHKRRITGAAFDSLSAMIAQLRRSVSKLIENSICFDICGHKTTIESPFRGITAELPHVRI